VAACELAKHDAHAFKWIVLALHSALQGSCVCHLTTTCSPIGVISDHDASQWLEYIENSRVDRSCIAPRTRILEFPKLLNKIGQPNSAGDASNESQIVITDDELKWWTGLHKNVRNQFVHFAPCGWSLEVNGISDLIDISVRIMRDILSKGWAFRHEDEDWQQSFLATLKQLEVKAEMLRDQFGYQNASPLIPRTGAVPMTVQFIPDSK